MACKRGFQRIFFQKPKWILDFRRNFFEQFEDLKDAGFLKDFFNDPDVNRLGFLKDFFQGSKRQLAWIYEGIFFQEPKGQTARIFKGFFFKEPKVNWFEFFKNCLGAWRNFVRVCKGQQPWILKGIFRGPKNQQAWIFNGIFLKD